MNFLITLGLVALSVVGGPKEKTVFSDNFNSKKVYYKNWSNNAADAENATVEYLSKGGIKNSGCVKISNPEKGSIKIMHDLKGLTPGQLYRMSAKIKCEGVKEGRGAVLFLNPEGLEQSWNASSFAYEDMDWTDVYMDFVPDQKGRATICCALGFPWGTYNGGKALGTVWYDDVRVEPITDQMYKRESKHIVVWFDPEKVTVTDEQMDQWLSKLDQVYEAYHDFVGDTPYGGRILSECTT